MEPILDGLNDFLIHNSYYLARMSEESPYSYGIFSSEDNGIQIATSFQTKCKDQEFDSSNQSVESILVADLLPNPDSPYFSEIDFEKTDRNSTKYHYKSKLPRGGQKKKQNINNCPNKYVLRNIGGKVLTLKKDNLSFEERVKKISAGRGLDTKNLFMYLSENEEELKFQLETRANLAKVFNRCLSTKKKHKSAPIDGKRGVFEFDHASFSLFLRDLYKEFIQDYGISYLVHSRISSDKKHYLRAFSTLLKSMRNPNELNNLTKF